MKKVSVITLSLVMLMNGSLAFSAPKKRRNAVNIKTNSVATTNATNSITLEELQAQNAMEELERSIQEEELKEINDLFSILNTNIEKAKSSCSGIKEDLKAIQVLTGVSTGASGLGAIASGTALGVGIAKANLDENIANTKAKLEKMTTAELKKRLDEIGETLSSLNRGISKAEKRSKTLGNVRTGLMAGSIATSATSTITSGISIKKLDDLIEKMRDCDMAAKQVHSNVSMIEAEVDDVKELNDNQVFKKAENIALFCEGLDSDNIKGIKKTLTASTVMGGIGAATSIAGTVTSVMANSKNVRNDDTEEGVKKEKDLNLASNIMAGISTGTSVGGTVFSAITLSKLAEDIDNAEKCEDALK